MLFWASTVPGAGSCHTIEPRGMVGWARSSSNFTRKPSAVSRRCASPPVSSSTRGTEWSDVMSGTGESQALAST